MTLLFIPSYPLICDSPKEKESRPGKSPPHVILTETEMAKNRRSLTPTQDDVQIKTKSTEEKGSHSNNGL